jgi:hypothetical protein
MTKSINSNCAVAGHARTCVELTSASLMMLDVDTSPIRFATSASLSLDEKVTKVAGTSNTKDCYNFFFKMTERYACLTAGHRENIRSCIGFTQNYSQAFLYKLTVSRSLLSES